jgi:NitT/TauT family transport system substrate-binding protein
MKNEFSVSRRKAVVLAASSIAAATLPRAGWAQSEQLRKATLRLNYVPNAEHAPYYLGLKKGFYKEQGVDLQILPGTGSNDTVRLVGAGNDMFGVAVADAVVTGRGRGAPVVSLGVLLQQSPNVMVSLKKNGITKPTTARKLAYRRAAPFMRSGWRSSRRLALMPRRSKPST